MADRNRECVVKIEHLSKEYRLGVIGGGMLTVLLIVCTYLFNDTISTPEDLEKKLGLNVLGTLPLEDAEYDGEKTKKKSKKKSTKKKTKKKGAEGL